MLLDYEMMSIFWGHPVIILKGFLKLFYSESEIIQYFYKYNTHKMHNKS